MRTAYDFSPLYRSMIGVDRIADQVETAARGGGDSHSPPYDIEKTGEASYRITLAAAGFSADELEITAQPNLLVIDGRRAKSDEGRAFLHRGIAGGDFQRRFELADYVVVKSANYADGVLSVDLAREAPERLKPRRVEIASAEGAPRGWRTYQDQPERRAA